MKTKLGRLFLLLVVLVAFAAACRTGRDETKLPEIEAVETGELPVPHVPYVSNRPDQVEIEVSYEISLPTWFYVYQTPEPSLVKFEWAEEEMGFVESLPPLIVEGANTELGQIGLYAYPEGGECYPWAEQRHDNTYVVRVDEGCWDLPDNLVIEVWPKFCQPLGTTEMFCERDGLQVLMDENSISFTAGGPFKPVYRAWLAELMSYQQYDATLPAVLQQGTNYLFTR